MLHQRLFINVDHIATIRQARRSAYPDPVEGAVACERAGADGITAHLREDRRHIQDDDVERLAKTVSTVFNLEMACTDEMIGIALRLRPHQVTLVPERREEITTEGGLDVLREKDRIEAGVARLNAAGIRTSLFVAPDRRTIEASRAVGAVGDRAAHGRLRPRAGLTWAISVTRRATGRRLGWRCMRDMDLQRRMWAPSQRSRRSRS